MSGAGPTHRRMLALLGVVVALVTMAGCGTTREETREEHRERNDTWEVSGSVSLPVTAPDGYVAAMPVGFTVSATRTGTEAMTGTAQATTRLDPGAIAGLVALALKTQIPGLAAFGAGASGPPPRGGRTGLETGSRAAAGIALAGLLERHLKARANRREADEAWDKYEHEMREWKTRRSDVPPPPPPEKGSPA